MVAYWSVRPGIKSFILLTGFRLVVLSTELYANKSPRAFFFCLQTNFKLKSVHLFNSYCCPFIYAAVWPEDVWPSFFLRFNNLRKFRNLKKFFVFCFLDEFPGIFLAVQYYKNIIMAFTYLPPIHFLRSLFACKKNNNKPKTHLEVYRM